MAKKFDHIEPAQHDFILRQKLFFVASSASGGRINLSPKGQDSFRILNANQVVYLDRTGSGNETAAHMLADGRLTIMFCAFDGPPMILRLYGHGKILARGSADYRKLLESAYQGIEPIGARHMVVQEIDLVQSSCGYAVPLMDFTSDRDGLDRWAESKGEQGLVDYRREKNSLSLDGLPTGIDAN